MAKQKQIKGSTVKRRGETWHVGPPPGIGWWQASVNGNYTDMWRWWNGYSWSLAVASTATRKEAAEAARHKSVGTGVLWRDYWPERARVPRPAPPRPVEPVSKDTDRFAYRPNGPFGRDVIDRKTGHFMGLPLAREYAALINSIPKELT